MSASVWSEVIRKKIIVAILLLAVVAGAVLLLSRYYNSQQLLKQEQNSLTATGTIEATTVDASFKVQGQISSLLVDEGDQVRQGQEIAQLDSTEVAASLVQAQGAAQAAAAQVQEADADVPLTSDQVNSGIDQAEAAVAKAQAGLQQAQEDYDRAKSLNASGAAPDSQFDEATNSYSAAQSDLQTAQSALAQALADKQQVSIAQAKYQAAVGQSTQAQGAVQEAQDYLNDTSMQAPMAGIITQKFVEQGDMVNALTPVYEITDLPHTYVKVYIDEEKIGRVHLGQDADVTVDTWPSRVFKGKVVLVNDAGDFAVRKALNDQYDHDIRYYEVKIDLPNSDLALKTGMTARVHILEAS